MASQKADLQTENRHSQFYEVKQVQQNKIRYNPDESEYQYEQNQIYQTINQDDELQIVDLQKSRVLLQNYIKNKFSSSLDHGQQQFKTERPKEELTPHLLVEEAQDYQTQLSQAQNLKKIQNMIGQMIKSKIDSSYVTSSECNYSDIDNNIQIEEQQDNYPEDSIINFETELLEQSKQIPLEKAELALTVAQICKEYLPNYSISNIVCLLKRFLDSSEQTQTKKQSTIQPQQRSRQITPNASAITSLPKQRAAKPGPPPKQMPAYQPSQSRVSNKTVRSRAKSEIQFSSKGGPSKMKVREQVQKQIAYVFVTKGYGLTLAKQHIKEEMDGNKYNSLLTSVIRSALRKLCDILTRNMRQQAKVFDMVEERLLRSPMVNCRKWLNRAEQHTFFKIINIAYGMNNEPIYQDEVINLYQKLLKQLQKRSEYNKERAQKKKRVDIIISTSKPNGFQPVTDPNKLKSTNTPSVPIPNIPINNKNATNIHHKASNDDKPQKNQKTIGDPAIEKQIAELFVTFKSEDSVYLLLTKRHPKISWDKKDIRNTLEKLIKIGLKKVLKFKKDHSQNGQEMPSLGLSENLVGKLLTHSLALQVRVAMVQVLMEKTLSAQRTLQLINLINSCLYQLSRAE